MPYFTLANLMTGYLNDTVALAAVALIGYLFGHRTRQQPKTIVDKKLQTELFRATDIAKSLQQIADRIRCDVATHQARISKFTSRMHDLQKSADQEQWHRLGNEAETLLTPTKELASNLTHAYDQIRKQSFQLVTFAKSRMDLRTNLYNRRVLEEQLEVLMSSKHRSRTPFSLALFTLNVTADPMEETHYSECQISFAHILKKSVRETDIVIQYSDEELAILMPQTTLPGASIFCERLMQCVQTELNTRLAGGIVSMLEGDSSQKLLSRIDSALYSARAQGESCLFQHNGTSLRKLERDSPKCFTGQEVALI